MLLAVLSVCCENESVAGSFSETAERHFQTDRKLILAEAVRPPSNSGEIEEDFFNEDLDFLEEEAEEETVQVADPLKPWNRAMFHFNDKFYFWVLKPVTQGYRFVIPEDIRVGVKNFFNNLAAPIRVANSLLQGKWGGAWAEFSRFFINSTVGVLGLADPASTSFPKWSQARKIWGRLSALMESITASTLYGLFWGFPPCVIPWDGSGMDFYAQPFISVPRKRLWRSGLTRR